MTTETTCPRNRVKAIRAAKRHVARQVWKVLRDHGLT
jgi:hypothetical protein